MASRRQILQYLLGSVCGCTSIAALSKGADERQLKSNSVAVIAIDAGHGGQDPGAIGPAGTQEKKITLQLAMMLKERLEQYPGVRVVLTRERDEFIPLNERVERARRAGAQLMVSIHADAAYNPDAQGASVYALSERGASSASAKWLAERENSVDRLGGVAWQQRSASVAEVLLDLSLSAQINESVTIGREVLASMSKVTRLHKSNVEQANFAVLRAPDLPSILIEAGFISHADEEQRLNDPRFQVLWCQAVAAAIYRHTRYKLN